MKKLVSLLLLLAMLLSALPTVLADEAPAYDGSEVSIVFYHTMDAAKQKLLDAYIADFNIRYPNISIP